MRQIQALCRDYGSSVFIDGNAVLFLFNEALSALGSSRDGAELFVELKECEGNKIKLESLLKVSPSNLSDAELRAQELQLTKDTVDQLVSKVDEAERRLSASQERVQYLEEKLAEQFNQLLAKYAEVANKL